MINYDPVSKIHESENGSIVLEVQEKSTKKHYALKLIGPLSYNLNRIIFERENNALKVLNGYEEIVHTYNVTRKLTYRKQRDFGGILLELIDGIPLSKFDAKDYSDTQKYNICIQIARGIMHAHDNGIIHRDIKPSNIMLTQSGKIKIIDFGSSKIKSLIERDTISNFYSPLYSAPEVFSGGLADEAGDIYSLGTVFFWIFFGQEPPKTNEKLIESIAGSSLRENFKALLYRMVDPDFEKRLNDVSVVVEEITKLIGNLNTHYKKFCFRVDIAKLTNLKKRNFILQSTTMQQLTNDILKKEFDNLYGNYNREKDTFEFVGNRLYMECIFNEKNDTFDAINLYDITLDRSLKLKRIFSSIEGTVKFFDTSQATSINNNFQLQNILKDFSSDICENQRKRQLFDQLFGKWEDSIQESLKAIKDKNAEIYYSEYELTKRQLILTINQYKNRVMDNIPLDTKYVIEGCIGTKTIFYRIGLFEYVKYEDDKAYIFISLCNNIKTSSIIKLLEKGVPVIEDYLYKANTYYKQLSALRALKNDEYNAYGLKDILLDIEVPGSILRIKSLKIDDELNQFQQQAVNNALCSESISLIQGPPGTGKTKVIGEILRQIFLTELNESNKIRILIVSQSNTAVDNVLEGIQTWIAKAKLRVLRIGDNKVSDIVSKVYSIEATRDRVFSEVQEKSTLYIDAKIKKYESASDHDQRTQGLERWYKIKEIQLDWLKRCGNREIIDNQLVGSSDIIAGTCVGFLSNEHVRDLSFDYVIVDEAAKATTPELLVSIIKANKIILVGDQNQLPPFADEELSPIAAQLVQDPHFRLFDLLYENLPRTHKQRLLTQYRMIQNIGDLISTVFYDGEIDTGIDDKQRQHNIKFLEGFSIIWYDTSAIAEHSQKQQTGGSYINITEKNIIHNILTKFDALENAMDLDIGIITGYSAQRDLIRKSVSNREFDKLKKPIIDTLDAFQGRENDIIIYSTVRTEKSIGFQKEKERINVAFSRAKCLLIVCGALDFFYSWDGGENKYVEIINYIKKFPENCCIINLNDGDCR